MKLPKLTIGVEIECSYNRALFTFPIGNYHEGQPVPGLPGWRAEEDSSLHTSDRAPSTFRCAEFVSKRCRGISELRTTLQLFKAYFSKSNKLKLKDVMDFNDSTGAHVHISTSSFKFGDRAVFNVLIATRDHFRASIKNSKIQSKDRILRRYFRSNYAAETTRENRFAGNRYQEFNHRSEDHGQGLEWRSPNMTGISTWEEFAEYWEIVFDSLQLLAKKTLSTEDYEEFVVEHETNGLTIRSEVSEEVRQASTLVVGTEDLSVPIPRRRTVRTHSRMNIKFTVPTTDEVTIHV